jgi:hypothetical protein
VALAETLDNAGAWKRQQIRLAAGLRNVQRRYNAAKAIGNDRDARALAQQARVLAGHVQAASAAYTELMTGARKLAKRHGVRLGRTTYASVPNGLYAVVRRTSSPGYAKLATAMLHAADSSIRTHGIPATIIPYAIREAAKVVDAPIAAKLREVADSMPQGKVSADSLWFYRQSYAVLREALSRAPKPHGFGARDWPYSPPIAPPGQPQGLSPGMHQPLPGHKGTGAGRGTFSLRDRFGKPLGFDQRKQAVDVIYRSGFLGGSTHVKEAGSPEAAIEQAVYAMYAGGARRFSTWNNGRRVSYNYKTGTVPGQLPSGTFRVGQRARR